MHRALTNKNFLGKKLGRYIYGGLSRLPAESGTHGIHLCQGALRCFCFCIYARRPPKTIATLFVSNVGVKLVSKEIT